MNDNKRLKNYDDLPLVLDVADIRRIMGISRVSAYELVHTPGFPAFRSGRLIKVSKKAFFDWMEKGTETLPKSSKRAHGIFPCLEYCRPCQRGLQRGKTLKMIPKRYTKTAYLRMHDRNRERSR